MNTGFAGAAAAAFVAFLVHWQVGGRHAARPLLAATELPAASKWLNYLCWHIATILLLAMALTLASASVGWIHADAVRLLAVMAASISVLSIAVTLRAKIRPWRFPSSYLLAAVAAFSLWGITVA
jgi:hypothetical protein